MRSHQQKFLETVEAAAKEYGLEVVVDYQYSNRGNITISFEDRFEPIVKLAFDFQTDYGTFDHANNLDAAFVNPERAGLKRKDWNGKETDEPDNRGQGRYWWYLKHDEFPKIIKLIRNRMAQAVMDRQKETL